MKSRKLGVAAASLLGAATILASAPSAYADEVCVACPTKPGANPLVKISDQLGKYGPGTPQADALTKITGKFAEVQDKW
jgi:hypothetical protein